LRHVLFDVNRPAVGLFSGHAPALPYLAARQQLKRAAGDMKTALILGSGPNVVAARDWPRAPFDLILAINNAWQVRPDWDALIYPWDFPQDRRPAEGHGREIVEQDRFVPAQNAYGGFVYAGGTMAFTAAYWALHAYRPDVIAMMGCDMHYPKGQTHFYGQGTADPLRADVTLQSLEAKSARLQVLAAQQGCAMVNLSGGPSRLTFPRSTPQNLRRAVPAPFEAHSAAAAHAREAELGYTCPSGRYWEDAQRYDAAQIRKLDALWLSCLDEADTGLAASRNAA
jgi:hypothetical protein